MLGLHFFFFFFFISLQPLCGTQDLLQAGPGLSAEAWPLVPLALSGLTCPEGGQMTRGRQLVKRPCLWKDGACGKLGGTCLSGGEDEPGAGARAKFDLPAPLHLA